MGHKINHLRNRLVLLMVASGLLGGVIILTNILLNGSFYYKAFGFNPTTEKPITVNIPRISVDPSQLDSNVPARAIPVIFYHGVLQDAAADNTNTTRSKFLSQMVALKEHGYYTITSQDLVDFYSGKKKFYGKPIMITFDDGRADSYVPTDDILKKLGFQAVFFIVSGKQDDHTDPFFLSWSALEQANQSGVWDLQAHGWYSHTKIPIDAQGDESNPLTNREWLAKDGRLETNAEAAARITNDYVQNIKDMTEHFPGHRIIAFAVPYGDYGQKENNFVNDAGAVQLNYDICQKYFKLCLDIDAQGYNFRRHDPLATERLEVQPGWWGQDLIDKLNANKPVSPNFSVDFTQPGAKAPGPLDLLGGQKMTGAGLRLTSESPDKGYVNYNLGIINSYNYSLQTTYKLAAGTSVYLSGYKYHDHVHSQDVRFGTTGGVVYLNLTKDGVDKTVASQAIPGFKDKAVHTLKMSLHGGHVVCWLDGHKLFSEKLALIEAHGTYGFDSYGPRGSDVTYRDLIVQSTGE